MITAKPISDRWGLFHRPPLGRWTKGRVTLLGDAAHALVPHHGQGANQSIEDAIVLAACLAEAAAAPLAEGSNATSGCAADARAKSSTRRSAWRTCYTCPMAITPTGATPGLDRSRVRCIIWGGSTGSTRAHEEPGERQGGTWL